MSQGPETKTSGNYYPKFLYSHLFGMSLSLPWQSIAWSCSGNLQEVAVSIIRPHTNLLGTLEKKVAIITLENTLYKTHKGKNKQFSDYTGLLF